MRICKGRRNPLWLVYDGLLLLSWPFLLLYYLLRARTDGKYGQSFRQRMGIIAPRRLPDSALRVWVHALSVGETLSVVPLVKEMRARCPDLEVVVSTSTETGRKMAEDRLASDAGLFLFLPHDFRWAVRKTIEQIRPNLFILVETDIWPNLLASLKESGIRTVLLNGRLSPRSFKRLSAVRPLISGVYTGFDLIFAQSQEDKKRYEALTGGAGEILAEGNIKLDSSMTPVTDAEPAAIRSNAGIGREQTVWVAGSTHKGEEEILLGVYESLKREYPGLLLILVPRHTNRGPEIRALCEKKGLDAAARSTGQTARDKDVYVLDTLGELNRFYAIADAAYIGGSMVPFGGHNPLEAVRWAKPALWGPHLFNFREIERELIEAGCGYRISSAEELTAALRRCFGDPAFKDEVGKAALDFMASRTGTSARIAEMLLADLPGYGRR